MPEGTHWEWRGFGRVSDEFRAVFERLPRRYTAGPEWDETKDQYLFVPGSAVNVKIRTGGSQQGLKLKRFAGREGGLELWVENPDETYLFAELDRYALAEVADLLGLRLRGHIRSGDLAPEHVLSHLRAATPAAEVVTVLKKRQTRVARPGVQVELCEITRVTHEGRELTVGLPLVAISVENTDDLHGRTGTERTAAGNDVRRALAELGVGAEALVPLNYLQAIGLWRGTLPRVAERSHVPRMRTA